MTTNYYNGSINVSDLKIWSHVGVLDKERKYGQWFTLNFSVKFNLDNNILKDDVKNCIDYSIAIKDIQKFSFEFSCMTIENFVEQISLRLEALYGRVPIHIHLTKCSPPVPGFMGSVSVELFKNGYI